MPRGGLSSRQIRGFRGAKGPVDPARPLGSSWEEERTDSHTQDVLTVFLAGAECPYSCVFCDLWMHTIDGTTAKGAIPDQLRLVLDEIATPSGNAAIKLYNASNFFDSRAVPEEDHQAIAHQVDAFTRVIVENHPKLTDDSCKRFADLLTGELEIAIGLETAQPRAHRLLNKGASIADFDRAAEILARDAIALRAFVLINPPYIEPEASVDWVYRSVQHALEAGARHVALIPTRGGNGALEHLAAIGEWTPPTMGDVERAFVECLTLPGIVSVDLWDWERLADCPCVADRTERLARMNLSGSVETLVQCEACGGSRA